MDDAKRQTRKKLTDLRAQLDRLGYSDTKTARELAATDELRRRMKKQKRPSPAAPAQSIVYRRDLPSPRKKPADDIVRARHVQLEQTVEGDEVGHSEKGKVYQVTTRVNDIDGAAHVSQVFSERFADGGSALCQRLSKLCDPRALRIEDVIFLDVESTGLGSSQVFLIGAMVWGDDGLEIHQYLARHYGEEPAALAFFVDLCASRRLLVTFNGKSFDFPFIRARSAASGVRFELRPLHFDLLHECRRVWRDFLPDCKLQTLESHVCRRTRVGDIPGSEIPEAYHAFVRTSNAWQIVEILKHNMLDLVTLADLMIRLPPLEPAPDGDATSRS